MKKRILSIILSIIFCLGMMPISVFADSIASDDILYLDWDPGQQKLVEKHYTETYTEIASDSTSLSEGWYLVSGYVEIVSRIEVSGDVHIILEDYAYLNAKKGITVQDTNSLTIYAQSTGANMGQLTATGGEYGAGIGGGINGSGGNITITGGNINATGSGGSGMSGGGAGIGGGVEGSGGSIYVLTKVNATGDNADDIGNGMKGFGGSGIRPTDTDNVYEVFGEASLHCDIIIPSGAIVNIPEGITLTIPDGKTLTNNGTINIHGTLTNNGTLINNGTINILGTLDNLNTLTNDGSIYKCDSGTFSSDIGDIEVSAAIPYLDWDYEKNTLT